MNGEDPQERPEEISSIIDGLERYNPEAVGSLENYLREQCEGKYCDCNANRTLLKLYQLNPDRMQNEVITNILVKSMTQFPSAQFPLALHLIPPAATAPGTELREAVVKLRSLNSQLEGAQYGAFWNALDDDLCTDLIADIAGFEDLVRERILALIGQAYRELPLAVTAAWLGMEKDMDAATKYVTEEHGWSVDADSGVVRVPRNADNEAKKTEAREDVNVDMFARVIRRSWEEVA